ncbi:MAG: class I SAM-dependent methyltransferase [Draconibacterium sp.]|nr:class I SAM-dependent methyltransferase [Draconibacterium sp.]
MTNDNILKMNNEQNKFYTSISKYYSDIFPYNPIQLQFVQNSIGNLEGKKILDIGCATGELAFQLAENGANVIGIDLNEDLLNQAMRCSSFKSADSKKCESEFASPNPKFQTGNMLELETDFNEMQFDAVLCFGNTLVHLPTTDLIQQMLKGVNEVLKPRGKFLMQILNYDYILREQVSELPIIENENIKFIRKYKFNNESSIIRFQTNLHLKKEGRVLANETSLFALKSNELIALLGNSGFKDIKLFSNFKKNIFGGPHLPLVILCSKE